MSNDLTEEYVGALKNKPIYISRETSLKEDFLKYTVTIFVSSFIFYLIFQEIFSSWHKKNLK